MRLMHYSSPVTRIVAVVLYALLLFMQQEAVRHGFDHLRSELAQAHDRQATLPVDTPCDECLLLAAGASALLGGSTIASPPPAQSPLVAVPLALAPRQAPQYYAARAPPVLS
jgi:hypothetical protein